MKPIKLLLLLLFLPVHIVLAQPDFISLQESWIQKLNVNESYEEMMLNRGYLLYYNGEGYLNNEYYEQERDDINLAFEGYEHIREFEHDRFRYGSVGALTFDDQTFLLFTGWRLVEDDWKKEIDIILTQSDSTSSPDERMQVVLDSERRHWVELANQHDPPAHVAELYAGGAVYFSNGSRSVGHEAIAERYFYMENPNYKVDLEKQYLRKMSDYKVFEVGRYFTGAERKGNGGLYVIIWEKETEGEWEIVLDFNF